MLTFLLRAAGTRFGLWGAVCAVGWLLLAGHAVAQAPVDVTELPPPSAIEQTLAERVEQNPQDAAAWRLLGRARLDRGDWTGALQALRQAVRYDSLSAAAYLDFGRALRHFGDHELAGLALQRTLDLAPESDYAAQARQFLEEWAAAPEIEQTSYEIRTFDGSNLTPLITDPDESMWDVLEDDLFIRLDVGVLYNDNVTLAPSSRELQAGGTDTAQGTASLVVQWYAANFDNFRAGPLLDLDFNWNEGSLNRFDLQSYRPGVFADGTWRAGSVKVKPRVTYSFTHDEFNGREFGDRHTIAASLGSYWTPTQISTLYYSIDNNDVVNDGATPDLTSQDGVSNTIGVLHDVVNRGSMFRQFRLGCDYSHVDTTGSNYRFQGVSLYTQGVFLLVEDVRLTLRGGWAYRDYFDYTLIPSRNTNIFRLSGELRRYFDYGFSAALVASYDRFDSESPLYTTDRFLAGGVVSWEF
jgi:hypothetical protein